MIKIRGKQIQKTTSALLITGVFSIFIFISWDSIWYPLFPKENKYQKKYNSERVKLNILPIPSDWITKDISKDVKFWYPKNKVTKGDTAVRFLKIIDVKNGQIINDIDKIGFWGSNQKTFKFVIETKYYYVEKKWTNNLLVYNDDGTMNKSEISIDMRDSILESWKFDYKEHLYPRYQLF